MTQRTCGIDPNFGYTREGIPHTNDKLDHWSHLNVCPKCGKKVTTCTLGIPPLYICDTCFPAGTIDITDIMKKKI